MSNSHRRSNQPRTHTAINSKLDRRLVSYAAAAGATCLVLAGSPGRAEAKIVYTATTTDVWAGSTIDLNNDGSPDFQFGLDFGDHVSAFVIHPVVTGNGILCIPGSHGCSDAQPALYGKAIGPAKQFISNTVNSASFSGGGVFIAGGGDYLETYFFGPWAGKKNRYLGLKFVIGSEVHYGWVRMSVGNWHKGGSVVITGYAYETEANKKILAGHETGPVESMNAVPAATKSSASLGALASGAAGLDVWRREHP